VASITIKNQPVGGAERRRRGSVLGSIVRFLAIAFFLGAILGVAGVVFAWSIGPERVCDGLVKVNEHGVNVPALLLRNCS
jgi:hypothetical protein